MKYLIGILLVSISFSCNALKKVPKEDSVAVEEVLEEVPEPTVPDLLPEDKSTQGDCKEDWSKKERKIIYRDEARIKRMYGVTDGEIYITARVDKSGYVSFAKINKLSTTVENQKLLNMALDIVQGYQFEPSETAPTNDCGVVKFNLNAM